MKKIKGIFVIAVIIMAFICFTGCNWFEDEFGRLKSSFSGRTAIIQTYDEDGDTIDSIRGKSIDIETVSKIV